jgi:hypothetical protein
MLHQALDSNKENRSNEPTKIFIDTADEWRVASTAII